MLDLRIESATTLRNALRSNAAFSGVSGGIIVLMHTQVTGWLGLAGLNISLVGYALLGFTVYLFWMSSRKQLQRALVTGVIAGDWSWVVGTAVLLALKSSSFSTLGIVLLIDVAIVVVVFAIWQQRGLRRLVTG